jgi:serine/threonine protein kinase
VNSALPLGSGDPTQLGPYAILSRIGGGGMGVVYLGQARNRRLVAVKVVRADRTSDPESAARFRREVRAASGVAGFCTARVLDADLDAPQPYYVTEYVQGPTLQEAVEEGGPFTDSRLEAFAVGVAEALEAIHAAGVVHRDLKPSNVLLAREGPKVIDFGIARTVDATTLTQTGKLVGSVNWLAPEQLRTGKASEASDVFAWGGLVTYAATGHPPFGHGPVGTIAHRILHEEPDLGGLSGRLLTAVRGAMDRDPKRRPSPRALLESLVAGARGDPVTAATEVVQRTWMIPRVPAGVATPPTPLRIPLTPPSAAPPATPPLAWRPGPEPAPVADSWRPGPEDAPAAVGWWPGPEPEPRAARLGGSDLDSGGRGAVPPDGVTAPGEPVPPEAGERERGARQPYARGTVLADLLPGGLLRDLALVAGFALLMLATLKSDDPVSAARVTAPALVGLVGAALIGRNRAASGFTLGTVGLYVLGSPPTTGVRAVLGYLVLLVGIGLTGTLAALGRRHKTIGAVVALAVGFALLQAFLTAVGWDDFQLPRLNLGPLDRFFGGR